MVLNADATKKVDYFGVLLEVPIKYRHIATNENGFVFAYENIPLRGGQEWWTREYHDRYFLGKVDLEGMNYQDSHMEIHQ